ncbi:MAG: RhuM family protein [Lysobacterales bacterium]
MNLNELFGNSEWFKPKAHARCAGWWITTVGRHPGRGLPGSSPRGVQFRQWASQRLSEYLVKGFAMDDERLKRGPDDGYFEELLARIRDIRSSERMFWRKVLDIYATSIDYDPAAEASQRFFQTVQNKMHWPRTATPPPKWWWRVPMPGSPTWA